MITTIIGFLTNATFLRYFKIGIVSGVLLFMFISVIYVKSIVNENDKLKRNYKSLELAYDTAIVEYENQLVFERDKNTFQETTLREKEQVIKSSEKVKFELQKRKEIKQDEKDCPKLGTFKL